MQIFAVVTLLGMQSNPTQAAIAFAAQVPLAVVAAGLVGPLAKTGRYTMHGMIAQLFAF